MNAILTWAAAHRRQLVLAGCACGLVAVGAAGGAWLHPRTVIQTVEVESKTVADESAGLDLQVHQQKVEAPTVKTRIIYRDGPVQERIVERTGGSTETTDTQAKVKDDLHVESTVTEHRVTVTAPEGRWSFGVLAGADSAGSVVAGAGVDYRFLGPATAGVQVLAPVAGAPGRFTLLFRLGLRL